MKTYIRHIVLGILIMLLIEHVNTHNYSKLPRQNGRWAKNK